MKSIFIKQESKIINLDKVRNITLSDEVIILEYDNYDENRLHGEVGDDWNCISVSYATEAQASKEFGRIVGFLNDWECQFITIAEE